MYYDQSWLIMHGFYTVIHLCHNILEKYYSTVHIYIFNSTSKFIDIEYVWM